MKVLCVGYWKTGTKSMSKALKVLGYKVYDYEEQIIHLKSLWKKFLDGTVTDQDIHDALEDIDVLIDGPTIPFWNEIYRVFPEAKVILTARDEEAWWKSWKNMNERYFKHPFLAFALLLSPTGISFAKFAQKIFDFAHGIESNHLIKFTWSANERLYKLKYRMHNSHVLQTVKSDAMLTHYSKEGWDPLCRFLCKDIPSIPYPHQNKNASLFQEDLKASPMFQGIIKEMFITIAVIIALIALLMWYFYFA